MQMAGKFGRPVVTFLDTPGAYPGIDAEERGQAEAIAATSVRWPGCRFPWWWFASEKAAVAEPSRWASGILF